MNRRQIGGYIWREQMSRIHKSIDNIRTLCNDIIDALGMHPPAVRLIVAYAAQIALELNECSAALRQIEIIAGDRE
jgi:hypothetical protein